MTYKEKPKWPCRVCGFDFEFDVWGGDDNSNCTYDICECCGAEAGADDFNLDVVRGYRKDWATSGYKWFMASKKPDNWSLEEQLKLIPERWR